MSQQGQWQVAGSAPEVYERELVPAVFGVWAPILVELPQPQPSECVLDVACGTGVVARIAATRVGPSGTVVGIDLNPGMLSVARSVVSPDTRSGGQLQWQEASADKRHSQMVHLTSYIASWACNSSPTGPRPYAKCVGFLVLKGDSR
jgi:SAM-dependent methyltransferase